MQQDQQGQQGQKTHDGRNDFDFLLGRWRVHNRKLRERLRGSTVWDEFEGQAVNRNILGGFGNLDEFTFDDPKGLVKAITVRLFNPTTQEWSIYWAADTNPTGILENPQIGKFDGNVGEFYALDTHQGNHIFCRFIWTVHSHDSCRWEQAFSEDGGRTWETNWIMDFERVSGEQM
jgi:hypothetical protein